MLEALSPALAQRLVERSAEAGDIAQSDEVGRAMLRLRKFMFEHVYLTPDAQRELPRVERMLRALFAHYAEHPPASQVPDATVEQRVVDYIAGMTDRYAIATFRRLALPEESKL